MRNSSELACTCPLHNDTNPSFSVNMRVAGHPWNCFVCGGGASVISLVCRKTGMTSADARKFIREEFNAVVEIPDDPNDFVNIWGAFLGHKTPSYVSPALVKAYPKAPEYHGFGKMELRRHGVRADVLHGRIIIPWPKYGTDDDYIGVTSHRAPGNGKGMKMVPLFGFSHKDHVYCSKREIRPSDTIVVVEGPADAIRLCSLGLFGVALAGSTITSNQAKELREIAPPGKPLVVMPDPDKAGLGMVLSVRRAFPERVVTWAKLTRADPADSTNAEIAEAIRSRIFVTPC